MKRALWALLFVVIGGVVAWLAMPTRSVAPAPPATASMEGTPVPTTDAPAALAAMREASRAWLEHPVTVMVDGARVDATREHLGVRVDGAHLQALAGELGDARSTLRRAHGRDKTTAATPIELPVPYVVDTQAALTALEQMKEELDVAPVDARYDFKTHELSADKPGKRIDVWATLAHVDEALAAGRTEVAAVIETVAAARPASRFAGVSTDAVLGWFETKYARDQKHEARTFNLRLAASRLDGYVILPGETFDFNAVVGPRTEVMGYRVAPVIAQGELVDGIGGGTCQIAGTLHAASFFAGLDMPERRPHTRPSFYIKMGLDAAVAYPAVDLQLSNPLPYPVVLHETVQGGMVRAEILGPKRVLDVTFGRRIDDVVRFAERDVNDPSLPKGARELKQRGIPGFKVTRWRILRDGPFAVREHHQDYYPPTTQIWRVGTGPEDPKFEANDDEHPEYVADQYDLMTQGPDIHGPHDSDMVEVRVPGKTGEYGWTVREGFAKETHGTHAKSAGDKDSENREGID